MPRCVIGLEIGGTKLQAAVGTEEGDILELRVGAAPASGGAKAILAWFERTVPELLAWAKSRGASVEAGCVGFGGPVESATGRALVSHQVAGWESVELTSWFEQTFALPVVIANDSNAAGWAEYRRGAGQGTRHFFYTNIGSGIGGALIMDGKLYDGQGRGAAELGHAYVPDWTSALPGASDKLEHLCSGWAIERRMRARRDLPKGSPLMTLCSGSPETITCAMLAEAARAGDAAALQEIDRVAEAVATALANVLALFHPERMAIGGGVGLMGETLLAPVRRHLAERAFGPYRGRYEVLPCVLEQSVVIVGALLLAGNVAKK